MAETIRERVIVNSSTTAMREREVPTQAPIDFDSDEPLACPLRTGGEDEVCESCQ